jgi:hypothetical protein
MREGDISMGGWIESCFVVKRELSMPESSAMETTVDVYYVEEEMC